MISSKGGEYVEVQVASPSHRSLHFGNVHTGHAVFPTACVSCRFRKMRIAKVRVTVLSSLVQTHTIGSMDTGCILFGNRSRSPMLGFLSATWPNCLFVAAASQNRCTSNLGLVVIGDILLPWHGCFLVAAKLNPINVWPKSGNLFGWEGPVSTATATSCYRTLQSIEALLRTMHWH